MKQEQLVKIRKTLEQFRDALNEAISQLFITLEEANIAEMKYAKELSGTGMESGFSGVSGCSGYCPECKNSHLCGWGLRRDGTHITVPCVSCREDDYKRVTQKLVTDKAFYSPHHCKHCGCNAAEQEGDCPAGKWWLACANCGKKL